jgi:hypothetical protein
LIKIEIGDNKIDMNTSLRESVGIAGVNLEELTSVSLNEKRNKISLYFEDNSKDMEVDLDAEGLKFYKIFYYYLHKKNEDAMNRLIKNF